MLIIITKYSLYVVVYNIASFSLNILSSLWIFLTQSEMIEGVYKTFYYLLCIVNSLYSLQISLYVPW